MLYVLTSQVCTTSPQSPCAALSDVLYGAWKSQHLDAVKYIGYTAWLQHLGTRRLITLQAGNGNMLNIFRRNQIFHVECETLSSPLASHLSPGKGSGSSPSPRLSPSWAWRPPITNSSSQATGLPLIYRGI